MHNVVASWVRFPATSRYNAMASGVGPHISIILGPAAGGAAYSPELTDFVVMVDKTSHMFITGPDVIKSVTGEEVDMETLGGARQHNETSGTAAYMAADEQDAFDWVSELLDYIPAHNFVTQDATFPQDLETNEQDLGLDTIIPDSANQPYDMLEIIATIVDDEALLQVQERYAPNVIVGFGRVAGRSVGVVANQPSQLAGTLDIAASEKAARFEIGRAHV